MSYLSPKQQDALRAELKNDPDYKLMSPSQRMRYDAELGLDPVNPAQAAQRGGVSDPDVMADAVKRYREAQQAKEQRSIQPTMSEGKVPPGFRLGDDGKLHGISDDLMDAAIGPKAGDVSGAASAVGGIAGRAIPGLGPVAGPLLGSAAGYAAGKGYELANGDDSVDAMKAHPWAHALHALLSVAPHGVAGALEQKLSTTPAQQLAKQTEQRGGDYLAGIGDKEATTMLQSGLKGQPFTASGRAGASLSLRTPVVQASQVEQQKIGSDLAKTFGDEANKARTLGQLQQQEPQLRDSARALTPGIVDAAGAHKANAQQVVQDQMTQDAKNMRVLQALRDGRGVTVGPDGKSISPNAQMPAPTSPDMPRSWVHQSDSPFTTGYDKLMLKQGNTPPPSMPTSRPGEMFDTRTGKPIMPPTPMSQDFPLGKDGANGTANILFRHPVEVSADPVPGHGYDRSSLIASIEDELKNGNPGDTPHVGTQRVENKINDAAAPQKVRARETKMYAKGTNTPDGESNPALQSSRDDLTDLKGQKKALGGGLNTNRKEQAKLTGIVSPEDEPGLRLAAGRAAGLGAPPAESSSWLGDALKPVTKTVAKAGSGLGQATGILQNPEQAALMEPRIAAQSAAQSRGVSMPPDPAAMAYANKAQVPGYARLLALAGQGAAPLAAKAAQGAVASAPPGMSTQTQGMLNQLLSAYSSQPNMSPARVKAADHLARLAPGLMLPTDDQLLQNGANQ